MSKYRIPSDKSKYYIPKEDYLTAIHYSLRYPIWKEEVEIMADTSKAITYDKDKVQSFSDYDSTMERAIKIAESNKQHKMQLEQQVLTLMQEQDLKTMMTALLMLNSKRKNR